jgi:hypothetical protein
MVDATDASGTFNAFAVIAQKHSLFYLSMFGHSQ